MSLPFLPPEHIVAAFNELKQQADESSLHQIIDLTSYVEVTWIRGTLWTPDNWNV